MLSEPIAYYSYTHTWHTAANYYAYMYSNFQQDCYNSIADLCNSQCASGGGGEHGWEFLEKKEIAVTIRNPQAKACIYTIFNVIQKTYQNPEGSPSELC